MRGPSSERMTVPDQAGLYCPRCGVAMDVVSGQVSCRSGDMDLSEAMTLALNELVALGPVMTRRSNVLWGGEWHCPADGTRMSEIDGFVSCTECARVLPGSVVYQLIELHAHAPNSFAELRRRYEALRLAELGGTDPTAKAAPRRRVRP